ncbi:MAG: Stk1 family PASTA domain-containing Ser/Thr kinase [Clostridiales bacterium]|nr:Stk1 family PASTA domain-containing Ser/Thr kinase [Clostridiales bacterium]
MDNFVGKRLDGRYELREIIGVGGMSVVYKAYDNIDDRIVAVKILKEEFLHNEEFKRRFKNESKAIAVLSHKNIVRVYNVSFGDRIQYIVEELVDGITLKEYIDQQGVVNWKEAVHFVGQILQALQHAHDKGIVHQDIKPQNIMLLSDGTIKVADFGIARFSRSDIDTTSENAIGSVHYISPEQARGEITDEKADIYSVGVMLYEMITGKLPFQADSAVSVALMQLQQDPTLPREINPSIPLGLEQITMRAMQKNPNERYHSAAEMLMDINSFKRNPAVKFNYTYFVDQSPTKYVPRTQQPVVNNQTYRDDNTEKKGLNKTTAIMIGAGAGVLVLLIIILALIFGANKVEVPDFISKNYYTEIEDNEEYEDFVFEIVPADEDNDYENGYIVDQDPEEGTKVKKGSTIKLTVVIKDSVVIDESIIGMTETEARQYLLSKSLQVGDVVYEYTEDKGPGIVIDVDPAPGQEVKAGSQINLTVTTDEQETVPVPDLYNMTKEEAETVLKASGLKLGSVKKVDSSEVEEGRVVSQSIKADEKIPINSSVSIEISNGKPSKRTAKITVKLPDTQANGKVEIYVNNEGVYDSDNIYLNGDSKTFNVEGTDADSSYFVLINGIKVQSGKIDFTSSSPSPTDVQDYEYVEQVVLPNVVDETKEDALKKLSAAGFTNVTVIEEENSAVTAGKVFEQSPDASSGSYKCAPNTKITLKVAKAAEVKPEEKPEENNAD